jgi:hypothetical protein
VVIESGGTPVHNGTVVNFSSTLGSVYPPEARTTNGIATAIFNSGSVSGTSVIHAFSGGAKTGAGNSSSGGVSIKIGAAAAGGISLSATPPSVSQSGGTVTISAFVTDPAGNPLPGVNVTFSSTTGALSSTTALTDSAGIARTTLATTSTATVNAFAGAAKADVQVTVSVAPGVSIEVSPASPTAGLPASFTFTPTGGSGNTSPRQIATLRVDFGDGGTQTFTNITAAVGTTHAYANAGGYTVTAVTVDVNGNTGISSRAIVVGFPAAPSVSLTASKTNPAVNEVFTVTVTPTASTTSNAPIRSVVVRTNDGTVLYSGTSGIATFPVSFSSSGARTLTATVTDAAAQTAQATIAIIVP